MACRAIPIIAFHRVQCMISISVQKKLEEDIQTTCKAQFVFDFINFV